MFSLSPYLLTRIQGVDVDWEYPGGNGEDYKQIPNSQKAEEIHNYPLLLSAIRQALGPNKIISAAVPGIHRDMLAFTPETVPQLSRTLDFLNVMTYDLMNRRDNVTKHHTGVQLSLEAIDLYERRGFPASKMNLGFAFYIKWFRTDPEFGEQCSANPIGCKTVLMEDPVTGADLGQAGAFSWHDPVPEELKGSYRKAMKHGKYDITGGGHYYWDSEEHLWWTWDTPEAVSKKIPEIVRGKKLGGVFAWGLGEDAPDFKHYEALRNAIFEQEDHESKDEL
ncbi:putative glycoside hydrolase family 18 protein [Phaeomoniella chlamydospora]|uniref:chitinase n=1 Tax=Phaeomoniella chlamydospora TaxID=158046 RepID=A0A0G2E764_PHACM|nr:putative glycoside hydrolase family 18 protein [Phaeomoniella chlamydospora]